MANENLNHLCRCTRVFTQFFYAKHSFSTTSHAYACNHSNIFSLYYGEENIKRIAKMNQWLKYVRWDKYSQSNDAKSCGCVCKYAVACLHNKEEILLLKIRSSIKKLNGSEMKFKMRKIVNSICIIQNSCLSFNLYTYICDMLVCQ